MTEGKIEVCGISPDTHFILNWYHTQSTDFTSKDSVTLVLYMSECLLHFLKTTLNTKVLKFRRKLSVIINIRLLVWFGLDDYSDQGFFYSFTREIKKKADWTFSTCAVRHADFPALDLSLEIVTRNLRKHYETLKTR